MKECFADANTGERSHDDVKDYNYDPTDCGGSSIDCFADHMHELVCFTLLYLACGDILEIASRHQVQEVGCK